MSCKEHNGLPGVTYHSAFSSTRQVPLCTPRKGYFLLNLTYRRFIYIWMVCSSSQIGDNTCTARDPPPPTPPLPQCHVNACALRVPLLLGPFGAELEDGRGSAGGDEGEALQQKSGMRLLNLNQVRIYIPGAYYPYILAGTLLYAIKLKISIIGEDVRKYCLDVFVNREQTNYCVSRKQDRKTGN